MPTEFAGEDHVAMFRVLFHHKVSIRSLCVTPLFNRTRWTGRTGNELFKSSKCLFGVLCSWSPINSVGIDDINRIVPSNLEIVLARSFGVTHRDGVIELPSTCLNASDGERAKEVGAFLNRFCVGDDLTGDD